MLAVGATTGTPYVVPASMEITLLVVLILANGLFAMSEIAVVTARKSRLQQLSDQGDTRAKAVLGLAENPTRFLSTVQVGITSIGILSGIVGENVLARPLAQWLRAMGWFADAADAVALGLVVLVITYFSLIVGELVPKRIGQINAETVARFCVGPMRMLSWVATPFVKLLSLSTDALLKLLGANTSGTPPVSEEEIRVLMEQGADAGVFEAAEHQMVRNVFRLDDRKLTSLMVPRADIVFLNIDASLEVNQSKIEVSHFSRFPVCRGDLSDVIGFARAKDLLGQVLAGRPLNLTAHLSPPLYVPETLTGTELIKNFRSARTQSALVVDEYGEIQGLVTLKDVLEAIIGELPAPQTEEASATQREDGSWLFDGLIAIQELEDTLELDTLPEGESGTYHTLSGMLMLLLGRIPRVADQIEWAGWRFEIVDMDGKRIDKVLAVRIDPALDETGKRTEAVPAVGNI